MARAQRAGRGLRAGRLDGRFGEGVILGRRDCYISLQGRSTCRENRNGPLGGPFDDGIIDFACRGVELTGEFSSLLTRQRGLGGRGRTRCVERE